MKMKLLLLTLVWVCLAACSFGVTPRHMTACATACPYGMESVSAARCVCTPSPDVCTPAEAP